MNMMMVRRLPLCIAMSVCGCLKPNPEYLGQGGTGSGGVDGSAATTDTAGTEATTSVPVGTGVDSASAEGEGTVSAGTESTDLAESTGGTPDTTGGATEVCPAGDALRVCLNFDAEAVSDVTDQSGSRLSGDGIGAALVDSPWGAAFEFSARTQVEVDCAGECAGGSTVTFEARVDLDEVPAAGGRAGIVDNNGILGMFVTDALALRRVSNDGTLEGG
ncbi:MAG: hypothetical protein ACRBN8_26770 [Nannocystales bacterium]